MINGLKTALLMVFGALLLWSTMTLLQAFAREGPDRSSRIQISLVLAILCAPVLSCVLRRRRRHLRLVLAAQLLLYIIYETGFSIGANIRADVLLIYPVILLNVWIAKRSGAFKFGPTSRK